MSRSWPLGNSNVWRDPGRFRHFRMHILNKNGPCLLHRSCLDFESATDGTHSLSYPMHRNSVHCCFQAYEQFYWLCKEFGGQWRIAMCNIVAKPRVGCCSFPSETLSREKTPDVSQVAGSPNTGLVFIETLMRHLSNKPAHPHDDPITTHNTWSWKSSGEKQLHVLSQINVQLN